MKATVEIEESLYDVLKETDLLKFKSKLAFEKQLTRLDHFNDVTDDELMSYGLSTPAVRRLRNAIEKHLRHAKKGKLFGNKRGKSVIISAGDDSSIGNNDSISESLPGPSALPCLIPRDEIKLLENIGEGTFALVKRGIWKRNDQRLDCAVKILHEMTEQIKADLYVEITSMQKIHHQNVVRLHGVVFGDPTLMVIEYCENGALLDRLRSAVKEKILVTRLLNYAQQIANGMSYLESRRFVHRDLAARNVLLTDNEEVVKICDFGLTRPLNENERLYVMSGQKKVPFSWCPPESLRYRQFSYKSDVWAFGVTLWELYTYGEEPWIGYKAIDVLKETESGGRLRIPKFCSKEIYDIMQMCWNSLPENRPKFNHLRTLLHDIKFTLAVCRTAHLSGEADILELQPDDRVILISERDNINWFGQSVTSHKFGIFPRSVVTLRSNSAPKPKMDSPAVISGKRTSLLMDSQNLFPKNRREISFPIEGSFIHAGHGDIDENKTWGYVEKIDDIYLKNPIMGNPLNSLQSKNEPKITTTMTREPELTKAKASQNEILINDSAFSSNGFLSDLSEFSNLSATNTTTTKYISNVTGVSGTELTSGSFLSDLDSFLSTSTSRTSTTMPFFNNSTSISTQQQNGNVKQNGEKPMKAFECISTKPPLTKSSKYDSAISIPRPNAARSSPISNTLRITPPPSKIDTAQTMVEWPSPCFLPAVSFFPPTHDSVSASKAAPFVATTSPYVPFCSSTANAISQTAISRPYDDENDPFVVKVDVKSLTAKKRYKEVLSNENIVVSPLNGIDQLLPKLSLPPPSTDPVINTTKSLSAINTNKINNDALIPATRVPNELSTKKSSTTTVPNNSFVNLSSSFLPPPSDLLLSGFNNTNAISNVLKNAGNSHLFVQQYNNSISSLNANNSSLSWLDNDKTGSVSSLYNGGGSVSSSSSLGSNIRFQQYQPIFALEGHNTTNNETLCQENRSRLRYGSNGIPILEPEPATVVYRCLSNQNGQEIKPPPPVIDLEDLNTDHLIAKVKSLVDFANLDQCRSSLRRHGFDVENAVRDLKAEKLVEMGLVGDKGLAVSALDSCQWDVNEAANRLVS